jgi:hypothetical protein
MAVGTVMALPFLGYFSQGLGWEWIFDINGGLLLIWPRFFSSMIRRINIGAPSF